MASSSSESEGEEDVDQEEDNEVPLQRSEPSSPVKKEPEEEDEKDVIPDTPSNDVKTKRRGRKLVSIQAKYLEAREYIDTRA